MTTTIPLHVDDDDEASKMIELGSFFRPRDFVQVSGENADRVG